LADSGGGALTITSNNSAIRSQVRTFILEKFPLARKRHIADDARLLESGVVDSLGILDVVAFLERTFRIKIDDEELVPENFGSIHDLAEFVSSKTGYLQFRQFETR
jgi:acyl carrier protein